MDSTKRTTVMAPAEPMTMMLLAGDDKSDGYPVVKQINKPRALRKDIEVGDMIFTIDLQSVRNWEIDKIQDILEKPSEFPQRRLVIIKQPDPVVEPTSPESGAAAAATTPRGRKSSRIADAKSQKRKRELALHKEAMEEQEEEERKKKAQKTGEQEQEQQAEVPPNDDGYDSNNPLLPEPLKFLKKLEDTEKYMHRPEVKEELVNSLDLHTIAEAYRRFLDSDQEAQSPKFVRAHINATRNKVLDQLNAIHTIPDQYLNRYEQDLRLVVQYRIQHGNCDIMINEKKWKELDANQRRLGQFVRKNRTRFRDHMKGEPKNKKFIRNVEYTKAIDDDMKYLDKLGFVWNTMPKPIAWEENFELLKQFAAEHGHTKVPQLYEPNQRLSGWVHNQRKEYEKFSCGEKSAMTPDRIQKLDDIGFVWKMRFGRPKKAKKQKPEENDNNDNEKAKSQEGTRNGDGQQQEAQQQAQDGNQEANQQQTQARPEAGPQQQHAARDRSTDDWKKQATHVTL